MQKIYRITLEDPLTEHYVKAFAQGMYFPFEDITTRSVALTILSDHSAELCLTEGRYRQMNRMFGRFDNKVLTLHRTAISNVELEPELGPGQFRTFTQIELDGRL